jgi:protein-S-isoprenylcysteine O-methyltransferase
VGTLRLKRVVRREKTWSRAGHLAILAAAFSLVFNQSARVGILGVRFLPESSLIDMLGLGITVAGCGFAVWARFRLGSNWSGTVTVKQDHELIRSGPYAIVRHPIYAGLLVGLVGTTLALGEVRGLLGLALAFVHWILKAQTEERFLVDQFGSAYLSYRSEVKQLIPFVF